MPRSPPDVVALPQGIRKHDSSGAIKTAKSCDRWAGTQQRHRANLLEKDNARKFTLGLIAAACRRCCAGSGSASACGLIGWVMVAGAAARASITPASAVHPAR